MYRPNTSSNHYIVMSVPLRRFKFEKLVRDNIIPQMKQNNQRPVGVRKLGKKEFIHELLRKMAEETSELFSTKNNDELKEELSDVLEIIKYLKKELNLTTGEINAVQKKKRKKNGGFDKRLYLDSVEISEDNKWLEYYLKYSDKYPEIRPQN